MFANFSGVDSSAEPTIRMMRLNAEWEEMLSVSVFCSFLQVDEIDINNLRAQVTII